MDIHATKLDIVQKLLTVSKVSLLEKVNALLDKEMTVGYTAEGQPLTKKTYNQRLRNAEQQIKSGQTLSQENLEEDARNW